MSEIFVLRAYSKWASRSFEYLVAEGCTLVFEHSLKSPDTWVIEHPNLSGKTYLIATCYSHQDPSLFLAVFVARAVQ